MMRARERGVQFRLQQQDARDLATRRQLEREQQQKLEWATAQFLQRIYRGYRGRCIYTEAYELRLTGLAATRVQAFQRGRRGRRKAWGMRRVKWSQMRVRERRRALAHFLRIVGFKQRATQLPVLARMYEL